MKRRKNPTALAVGAALIVVGVLPFLGVTFPVASVALLIAGGAVLLGLRRQAFGTILLAVWLLALGATTLVDISIPMLGTILSVLAILAGVLILIDR